MLALFAPQVKAWLLHTQNGVTLRTWLADVLVWKALQFLVPSWILSLCSKVCITATQEIQSHSVGLQPSTLACLCSPLTMSACAGCAHHRSHTAADCNAASITAGAAACGCSNLAPPGRCACFGCPLILLQLS